MSKFHKMQMNTNLLYMTIWFFGLSLALVLLPLPMNEWIDGPATDWVSFSIMLIGVLGAVICLVVRYFKKDLSLFVLYAYIIYVIVTMLLVIVDFGSGWAVTSLIVGLVLHGITLTSMALYGFFVLRKQKKYVLCAYLLSSIWIQLFFTVDASIIFYPEIHQSLPLYSLIGYVLSWVAIQMTYHMSRQPH